MIKLIKIIVLIAVALFCWGWISNVFLGGMTTEAYIRKINNGLDQWVTNGAERILQTPYVSRATANWKTFYTKSDV